MCLRRKKAPWLLGAVKRPQGQSARRAYLLFSMLMTFTLIFAPVAQAQTCPGTLTDRADVVVATPGNDYDVYYNNTPTSGDFFSDVRAGWARDTLANAHGLYTNAPYNFQNPFFSASPNDTCIHDSANIGTAPENRITLDSPALRLQPEPYLRAILAHELFHHIEFNYIDFNQWPSWGAWNVEGTARAMEDKLWLDNDSTPANTLYVDEVNDYLGNPNRNLFNISYTAALFWTYLTEQLGAPFPEPALGVNVIQRFWTLTEGNSPDGVRYLRDAIRSFDSSETLESLFRDFAITNYTHDLDVSGLPDPDRFRYRDEAAAGGGTAYDPVVRDVIPAINTTYSASVNRWAARYFEINVNQDRCQAVGFWVKAKNNKRLHYAVVGISAGNRVTQIFHGSGNEFYRSVVNPPTDPYTRMALIVIGMNESADFDYAFGSGNISGQIRNPTFSRMAYVGSVDDPERFQAWLLLQGPASLTPAGMGAVSMKGLDPSQFLVTLRSAATGNTYEAAVLNGAYVDGEYWLTIQAPPITSARDGILFDLEICFCEALGSCAQNLTSADSVLYADRTLFQMHVLDRSYSMHWPQPAEDAKITAAKNAVRSYINAGDDDDQMGVVTFTGNDSECDNDARLDHGLGSVATDRGSMLTAVDNVVEDGWTSIGDGLKMARDELLAAAGRADEESIVLYSDGKENEGDFWSRSNGPCGTPPVADSFDRLTGFAKGIRIDTIAFGSDANQELAAAHRRFCRWTLLRRQHQRTKRQRYPHFGLSRRSDGRRVGSGSASGAEPAGRRLSHHRGRPARTGPALLANEQPDSRHAAELRHSSDGEAGRRRGTGRVRLQLALG